MIKEAVRRISIIIDADWPDKSILALHIGVLTRSWKKQLEHVVAT